MRSMSKWQRVEAALHGDVVDRVPISLWKHYHLQDRAPRRLAEATLALYRQFDSDLIKLTPSGLYPIQDWGAVIRFGRDDDTAPQTVQSVIREPDDWKQLPLLDIHNGALARELEMIHHVSQMLQNEAPCMMTIFSPLTIAYKLRQGHVPGETVVEDLRHEPDKLKAGLEVIAQTTANYAQACLDAGASGIFFATQMSTYDLMSEAEYREFGLEYDLRVMEAVQAKSKVTMLHICRRNIMFDLMAEYPVHVIHWADREGPPTLQEARRKTDRALAGGLSLDTLLRGSVEDVKAEARDAIMQTGGRGFILAPACVVRGSSPDANLAAVRQAAEEAARSL